MTVDVPMTWIQCLCPMVMTHLEQAAYFCFLNRGLGDRMFTVGLVDLCAEQSLLQQFNLYIKKPISTCNAAKVFDVTVPSHARL